MNVDKLTDYLWESIITTENAIKEENDKSLGVRDTIKIQQLIGKYRGLKIALDKVIELKIEAN